MPKTIVQHLADSSDDGPVKFCDRTPIERFSAAVGDRLILCENCAASLKAENNGDQKQRS